MQRCLANGVVSVHPPLRCRWPSKRLMSSFKSSSRPTTSSSCSIFRVVKALDLPIDEVIEQWCTLLRCMSRLWAYSGRLTISGLSPLAGKTLPITVIPIVIAFSGNPERHGVVGSLARPGGNLTGFSYMSGDLAGKRVELLCSALAKCSRVAALYNPQEPPTTLELEETAAAARTLGATLQPVAARYADELEQAFASAERAQAEGLLVFTHGFAVLNRARIMELAARQRLPVMYGWREFVEEGGLMSYGPDIRILVRQAAIYVDRILRGEKPSNLPVQQPTRLELIINLKTARALGLEAPPTLLARADEVIK
jgi:putative tryptophan/tyrosine transport system substrate-binding protein